jgi:hypothetical protein
MKEQVVITFESINEFYTWKEKLVRSAVEIEHREKFSIIEAIIKLIEINPTEAYNFLHMYPNIGGTSLEDYAKWLDYHIAEGKIKQQEPYKNVDWYEEQKAKIEAAENYIV